MNANHLLDLVKRYQDNRDFITNEETTKMALVVPFIRHLGYDPNLPREVKVEFTAEFTQGDGKRFADRMDFAIFDQSGTRPLLIIETKPLGTDVRAKSQQLARYIAQMRDLHFGIITDGCRYLFYGDLENPNQMDNEPFFNFSLSDLNTDWAKTANFLSKFSRDAFNAETLVTDAENSRYRQAMIEKLSLALKNPASDDGFMKWLTDAVYKGKRTTTVMERLSEVASEAIEPALIRMLEDDFLDKLKERFQRARDKEGGANDTKENIETKDVAKKTEVSKDTIEPLSKIVTTEEELQFYEAVRNLCGSAGLDPNDIVYRDTINYFNISFRKPTKWFLRFMCSGKGKSIITPLSVEETNELAKGFRTAAAPPAFGSSRVYITDIAEVADLKALILKSLEVTQSSNEVSLTQ